jgi:hypothetical protein
LKEIGKTDVKLWYEQLTFFLYLQLTFFSVWRWYQHHVRRQSKYRPPDFPLRIRMNVGDCFFVYRVRTFPVEILLIGDGGYESIDLFIDGVGRRSAASAPNSPTDFGRSRPNFYFAHPTN